MSLSGKYVLSVRRRERLFTREFVSPYRDVKCSAWGIRYLACTHLENMSIQKMTISFNFIT